MSYLSHTTPTQREKVRADQVENNAGGFVWQVGPFERLQRFLVLGTEGGTYYQRQRDITRQNIQCIDECLNTDAPRTLKLITDISVSGRASKNDPALYALARACAHPDTLVRRWGFQCLPAVVRTGTHLFMFEHFVLTMRGHGRSFRTGIASWYESKSAESLAYQLVKYRERDFAGRKTGRRHADLIKTARPHVDNPAWNDVIRWALDKGVSQPASLPQVIRGFQEAQAAESSTQLVGIINNYKLPWEAVPRDLMDASVWRALLPHMPMMAMTRNLATMTRVGAVEPMSDESRYIVDQLNDLEAVQGSKIHPIQMLAAHLTYRSGRSVRGKGEWTPVPAIVDATDRAFYLTFGNVTPMDKRVCLALDVSGSMEMGSVGGVPGLTPRVASAAMSLVTAAVESHYQVVGFTGNYGRGAGGWRMGDTQLTELDITPKQRLSDALKTVSGLSFGTTDCALPMLWAMEKNRNFDLFVIYTDNETWAGNVQPAEALRQYRNKVNANAKLVVVGMTATDFSIADPQDGGMLDVVGFDTNTPNAIAEFAKL